MCLKSLTPFLFIFLFFPKTLRAEAKRDLFEVGNITYTQSPSTSFEDDNDISKNNIQGWFRIPFKSEKNIFIPKLKYGIETLDLHSPLWPKIETNRNIELGLKDAIFWDDYFLVADLTLGYYWAGSFGEESFRDEYSALFGLTRKNKDVAGLGLNYSKVMGYRTISPLILFQRKFSSKLSCDLLLPFEAALIYKTNETRSISLVWDWSFKGHVFTDKGIWEKKYLVEENKELALKYETIVSKNTFWWISGGYLFGHTLKINDSDNTLLDEKIAPGALLKSGFSLKF